VKGIERCVIVLACKKIRPLVSCQSLETSWNIVRCARWRLAACRTQPVNTMRSISLAVPLCLLAFVSNVALGAQAVTSKAVNLRAGPDQGYPLVARLAPHRHVNVLGCVNGYAWCDMYAGHERGWVYGGNLTAIHLHHRVELIQYGALVGLPVVAFSLNSYWNSHYRHRPWYRERSHWAHRLPHVRPQPHRPPIRPPVTVHPGRPGIFRCRRPGDRRLTLDRRSRNPECVR
jgi:uncharacterized protein YraI